MRLKLYKAKLKYNLAVELIPIARNPDPAGSGSVKDKKIKKSAVGS